MIPRVMGVLNVTPDSFSDGGRYASVDDVLAEAGRMIAEGASVIDVGGESTRPGAVPVDPETELARVLPVVEGLAPLVAEIGVRISIDTRHDEVARAAVAAGATIVNDVSASLHEVAADTGAAWIAMHMAGEPSTMQDEPAYGDVVTEVTAFLVERAEAATAAGVAEIWIDPGLGFGKTVDHNIELISRLDELVATGWPVVVGASRKATMGVLSGRSDARVGIGTGDATPTDDRLEASLAVATWAMSQGVDMVRAHDVRPHVHAAKVVAGTIPPKPPIGAQESAPNGAQSKETF
ncbi:MAG TPA: dihydropteroate synthase [Microthrixaceae bacterium]|nr:dihydropteroate synthase [Microthrixaceae bacterium]